MRKRNHPNLGHELHSLTPPAKPYPLIWPDSRDFPTSYIFLQLEECDSCLADLTDKRKGGGGGGTKMKVECLGTVPKQKASFRVGSAER